MEVLDEVQIHADIPEHKAQIGSRLDPTIRKKLVNFLKQCHGSFAWTHADMVGIDPKVIVHRFQVNPDHRPVKQKRRKFAPD